MIERSELEGVIDLSELYEDNMRMLVKERSGGVSEVTGRLADKMELHHILGRNKPRGFKYLDDIIQAWWPHVPPGCIFLTVAEHTHAGRNSKMMKPRLLGWLLLYHGDRIWEGKSYREWLNEPPFKEWL